MKTILVTAALLIVNTTFLLSEPLSNLINGINTWVLIFIEILLLGLYLTLRFIKNFQKELEIDFKDLNIFVPGSKDSGSKYHLF